MNWNKLLNNGRRKDKHKHLTEKKEGCFLESEWGMVEKVGYREELERDYDRILFLAPTRRLSDKTQVFPLEQNDSVRTRLTHSYEVSNLARSIGTQLAYEHSELFEGNGLDKRNSQLTRSLPSLLAAIGLAHDLGNPPFGHQGETAIQDWFKANKENVFSYPEETMPLYYNDFLNFDGNSQTIRLLTQLQILNDKFGINLTYATLAALLKYPQSSTHIARTKQSIEEWKKSHGEEEQCPISDVTWKKHGYFHSEEYLVQDVWQETGLQEGLRHPVTYIMEACDDIAYSVLDAEDIVKKGLASFHDLVNHLEHYMTCKKGQECAEQSAKFEVINKVLESSKRMHVEFSNPSLNLTPAELNDVSMQMFRVHAIGQLVSGVTEAFKEQIDKLTSESCTIKDLMSLSKGSELCGALKSFDLKWGYKNKTVLKLELQGHNYIHGLMDMLWVGIHGRLSSTDKKASDTPFGKYAYGKISENYRRVFEDKDNELPESYKEAQLLTDAVSGMTDSYLIDLYNELKGLKPS